MTDTKKQTPKPRPDLEAIRGAVARGWCAEVNKNKIMDADLADVITEEVHKLLRGEK